MMADETEQALATVGPRLRSLRQDRGTSLAEVSAVTGISVSTLSRLESGQRRATLELLLPLAGAYQVSLDQIVTAPVADPRVRPSSFRRHGMTYYPLNRKPVGLQAYKLVIPAGSSRRLPDLRSHEGYEWLYVLDGRLRLVLAEHDVVLTQGEAAEFDTRVPHWFGAAGPEAVQLLSLFGPQGERVHVRAAPVEQDGGETPRARSGKS
jgi:transcriptional regulator with XRE-family HTH domain